MDEELIVDFPEVLKTSDKILLGKFSTTEILIVLMAALGGGSIIHEMGLGFYGYLLTGIFVGGYVLLKLATPEGVGIEYFAKVMNANKTLSYEDDTSKYVSSVKSVKDWYVRTPYGYVAVVEVQPVDFFYTSLEERKNAYRAYATFLNNVEFPVQILCLSTEFDVSRYLNRIMLRMRDEDVVYNDALRDVVKGYLDWLSETVSAVKHRKYYVVVSVRDSELKNVKEEQKLNELRKRVVTVETALRNGGINARVLPRNDVFKLYEMIFTRRANIAGNYNSTVLFMLKE